MKPTTCAFTGHRPKSFPWKYDEAAPGCILLKKVLMEQISALAERGVTDFLSGMALGTDLWCSRIVLNLHRKYPDLKLRCVLPCEEQDIKWDASTRAEYRSILNQADEVIYVSRTYHKNCMMDRNRYLVDHSSILLAVYNGAQRSGTGATVRYAQQKEQSIILIDPISRQITQQTSPMQGCAKSN